MLELFEIRLNVCFVTTSLLWGPDNGTPFKLIYSPALNPYLDHTALIQHQAFLNQLLFPSLTWTALRLINRFWLMPLMFGFKSYVSIAVKLRSSPEPYIYTTFTPKYARNDAISRGPPIRNFRLNLDMFRYVRIFYINIGL